MKPSRGARARQAGRGERLKGAKRFRIGDERTHGRELLRKRIATLDGRAQRYRHERKTPGLVGARRGGDARLGRFERLLQCGDARAERLDLLVIGSLRGGSGSIFLRGLERRVGAGLRVARGCTRAVDTRAKLGERADRGFERGDARRERLIGLCGTRRGRRLLGPGDTLLRLAEAAVEIGEAGHRLFGGSHASAQIRDRARIGGHRLRPRGEIRYPLFEAGDPGGERRGQIVARAERARGPDHEK